MKTDETDTRAREFKKKERKNLGYLRIRGIRSPSKDWKPNEVNVWGGQRAMRSFQCSRVLEPVWSRRRHGILGSGVEWSGWQAWRAAGSCRRRPGSIHLYPWSHGRVRPVSTSVVLSRSLKRCVSRRGWRARPWETSGWRMFFFCEGGWRMLISARNQFLIFLFRPCLDL